ncbi:hypothetical protein [Bradyrhizobium elkanii]|uniref:hypothetical protein n=1 Tax=Bradyrhizobium elkanii TaxID=29448 RepID=UPI000483155A|nr:hypothetical protein [Bradyrhizobium elkanii]
MATLWAVCLPKNPTIKSVQIDCGQFGLLFHHFPCTPLCWRQRTAGRSIGCDKIAEFRITIAAFVDHEGDH